MTTEVPIDDVFAVALPQDMNADDPETRQQLDVLAKELAWSQYTDDKPLMLRFDLTEWLITRDADEVDAFQPTHDCVACRAGADQIRAFLREHPQRWVVLGNMHYVEVWP